MSGTSRMNVEAKLFCELFEDAIMSYKNFLVHNIILKELCK